MTWSFACPDWEARIREGRSLIPALPLNQAEAKRAVGIFNRLRLPDVPGTPTLEHAAGEWFREIVATLFGSLMDIGGVPTRMVREPFLLVPKKNNKTTGAAAVMMTALLMNARPRAEMLLLGPTQAIADLAYSQGIGMIDADDAAQKEINGKEGFLKRRLQVQDHLKTITDRKTKAKLRIKAFDPSVLTGPKPAAVLVDELHEIAKMAKAANIIGQLRGGMISQPEAFMMFITTQSDEPPVGVFASELAQARSIRDGRLTGVPMLPVLYEFPEEIAAPVRPGETPAWYDPELWPMVTPNLGRSITLERLITDFRAAQAKGDAEIRRWASQHLNIEIGLALRSDRWRGADHWEGRADKTITLEALIARCEVIVFGVDGGGLDDMLGLCGVGREKETRRWLAWNKTWLHQDVLKIRKSEATRFRDFETVGELVIVDDMAEAFADLAETVRQVDETGLLPDKNAVGMDPMGVGMIVEALAEAGIEGEGRVIGISQGWKLNGAIKTTEVKLASGELVHAGQAITAYAAGNAKVEPKGNAVTITKQAAGTAKIDPLMALFDGVALMSMNPASRLGFDETYELPVIG